MHRITIFVVGLRDLISLTYVLTTHLVTRPNASEQKIALRKVPGLGWGGRRNSKKKLVNV
jgi:hypothetical protein